MGRQYWGYLLGVLFITAFVFSPSLGFEFLSYDDFQTVARNEILSQPFWDSLRRIWTAPYFNHYIPISYSVSLAMVSIFGKSDPLPFHALNILLHLANTALVFGLLAKILKHASPLHIAMGTLIFAVHSAQLESVAWVSALNVLLFSFFGLIAFHFHIRRRQQGTVWYSQDGLLTLLFLSLSELSKSMGASLILLMLAYDLISQRVAWRRALLETLPAVLMTVPLAVIGTRALDDITFVRLTPPWTRPIIALDAIGFYLRSVFTPFLVSADYGRNPSHVWNTLPFYLYVTLAVITTAAAIWVRKRNRTIFLSFVFFVAAMLPALGFAPFGFQNMSTVADRYLYLSLVGVALAFVEGIRLMPKHWATAGGSFIVGIIAALSFNQVYAWENTLTLFTKLERQNPDSIIAHSHLGYYHAFRGNLQHALYHYKRAIEIRRERWGFWLSYGETLRKLGRYQEALDAANYALVLKPENAEVKKLLEMINSSMALSRRPSSPENRSRSE